jgi:acetyl esterase/lipase
MNSEGRLDPWVEDWIRANPDRAKPLENVSPELLEVARGPWGYPPTREVGDISDSEVEGIAVRVYRPAGPPTGVVTYFHGGGFVMGSIGIMDNVARELAHAASAIVVSVGYRLAPEHPYPAGLDDCETVTRWVHANRSTLGAAGAQVAVAGESAGGNLATAVCLRLRDGGEDFLVGQVLIYPAVTGKKVFPSRKEFDGLIISLAAGAQYWAAYSGGRDLEDDPYAVPLAAEDLEGLPPALVVLGGCDMFRDEGRAYADRLRDDGVAADEACYAGQPHGFVNFGFPAAELAFERIGTWLRAAFASRT